MYRIRSHGMPDMPLLGPRRATKCEVLLQVEIAGTLVPMNLQALDVCRTTTWTSRPSQQPATNTFCAKASGTGSQS